MSTSDAGDWCLIESDPGVFTELIKGFGAKGLECDEVYDLKETDSVSDAFGLIFLFKWDGKKNSEETYVEDARTRGLFFAKQVITNACATQAIINILLNIDESKFELGETLKQFKTFVADFDSTMKGAALSNSDQIRAVHNSFSSFQIFEFTGKRSRPGEEVYHFVGYLPVGGVLYELDGLKDGPIDHGKIPEGISWLNFARPLLEERMQKCVDGNFNLMAVVPQRLSIYERQLAQLKASTKDKSSELIRELENNIENRKRKAESYHQENIRRRHNYLPLIVELFRILAENSALVDSVNKAKAVAQERKNARAAASKS
ncbi:unnamed protein product [Dicrocoelium dendriticum]|nr:unnamed protein product [Dicrocoelium dendriticum]CAH8572850.1 unnamed protein product [Dicrocoelium dendriticum]